MVNHSESSKNSISSKRKLKINLGTPNRWPHIVPKTCFQGRLGDVLRTSWGRPETTSQGRPLEVRLGRPQDVRSRRPQDVSSVYPRDGQIGSLGDLLWMLERNVLGTSWGPVFAGCDGFHQPYVYSFCHIAEYFHDLSLWFGKKQLQFRPCWQVKILSRFMWRFNFPFFLFFIFFYLFIYFFFVFTLSSKVRSNNWSSPEWFWK